MPFLPNVVIRTRSHFWCGTPDLQVSSHYVLFLWRFSRTAKVVARTFAVEMAASTLQAAAISDSVILLDSTPQTLWRLLIQHIADKAAGVRSKALGCLASLLTVLNDQPDRQLLRLVQQPLTLVSPSPNASPTSAYDPQPPRTPSNPSREDASPMQSGTPNGLGSKGSKTSTSPSTPSPCPSPSVSLQQAAASMDASLPVLGTLLQRRCIDERPAVRRSALSAIEAWARASGLQLSPSQLSLLSQRCQDTSPAIRKQAARSLTSLLRLDAQSAPLRAAWIAGVLPLSQDAEASVCEACFEAVLDIILLPLARSKGDAQRVVNLPLWQVLEDLQVDTLPLLRNCMKRLSLTGKLPDGLAPALVTLLTPQAVGQALAPLGRGRQAAWGMLVEMSNLKGGERSIETSRVLLAWEASKASEDDGDVSCDALRVLVSLAKHGCLNRAACASLAKELYSRLCSFDTTAELACLLVQACAALDGGELGSWSAELLDRCETALSAASEPVEQLRVYLLVAGELAIVAPGGASNRLASVVQSLIHATDGGEVRPQQQLALNIIQLRCLEASLIA